MQKACRLTCWIKNAFEKVTMTTIKNSWRKATGLVIHDNDENVIDDEEGDADGDDDSDDEEEEVNDFLILSPWAVREVSSDVQEEIEQETTTVIIDESELD